jgi:hypothetical protein
MAQLSFHDEIERAIQEYEGVTGHYAARTRKMITDHGEIGALSLLMVSPDLQTGFQALRDAGLLEYTFESIVVRFPHLFSPDVVQAARWRLDHAHELLEVL